MSEVETDVPSEMTFEQILEEVKSEEIPVEETPVEEKVKKIEEKIADIQIVDPIEEKSSEEVKKKESKKEQCSKCMKWLTVKALRTSHNCTIPKKTRKDAKPYLTEKAEPLPKRPPPPPIATRSVTVSDPVVLTEEDVMSATHVFRRLREEQRAHKVKKWRESMFA